MRGTLGETFERLILLQIGAAAATRERIEEVVEGLIEQGSIQREEQDPRGSGRGPRVAGAARSGGRRRSRASAGRPPAAEDYEDLIFREQLEHRVRCSGTGPCCPPPSRRLRARRTEGTGPSPARRPRRGAPSAADRNPSGLAEFVCG